MKCKNLAIAIACSGLLSQMIACAKTGPSDFESQSPSISESSSIKEDNKEIQESSESEEESSVDSSQETEKETSEKSAESNEDEKSTGEPDLPKDNAPSNEPDSLEAVYESALKDAEDTVSNLENDFSDLCGSVNSYQKILNSTDQLDDFYEHIAEETEQLAYRIKDQAAIYSMLIIQSGEPFDDKYDDMKGLYDDFYDGVCEIIYDDLYDGLLEDAYDYYYDGILDDAYDNDEYSEYKEWSNAHSDEYSRWSDAHSDIYEIYSDTHSDIYGLYSDLRSCLYQDNQEKAEKKLSKFIEKLQKEAGASAAASLFTASTDSKDSAESEKESSSSMETEKENSAENKESEKADSQSDQSEDKDKNPASIEKQAASEKQSESSSSKPVQQQQPAKPEVQEKTQTTTDTESTTTVTESTTTVEKSKTGNTQSEIEAYASESGNSGGIRSEFKAAMDAYEAFYDEYCSIMKSYSENPADFTLLAQYTELLDKMDEVNNAFEAWDDSDLNNTELKYYIEVNSRVLQKLADLGS